MNKKDLQQIEQRGSNVEEVIERFSYYTSGFDFMNIVKPATLQNGIHRFSEEEVLNITLNYQHLLKERKIVKFVPASGAASRMFKELFEIMDNNDDQKGADFISKLQKFAFYEDLQKTMLQNGYHLEEESKKLNYKLIIDFILNEKGLNYKNLPKALIQFHRYDDHNRLALEEHLVEAAMYGNNGDGICRLHFTLSPAHVNLFKNTLNQLIPIHEKRFNVSFDISTSIQSQATDTLAATLRNEPFRDENALLLFRQGGHGALIKNLQNIDADIVFIKNIDNVSSEQQFCRTLNYKKLLAVILISLKEKIDYYLTHIEQGEGASLQAEIIQFLNTTFCQEVAVKVSIDLLFNLLNRPLRVCGMVKNEGEPGGGPFIVKNANNDYSLQIVESAQIDLKNPEKRAIVDLSTHFNPVDLVCYVKDFKGKHFDLEQFIDPYTGFISEKSYQGRQLKAMELPGLWNGSMAFWNTFFIEVPLETFNPVKTIFDLLKHN
ncbi:MAG: DUF4301 family protein [Bacteroidales bacterium]|nr:DUF4301 family protein [Bacteroidales bacterium]